MRTYDNEELQRIEAKETLLKLQEIINELGNSETIKENYRKLDGAKSFKEIQDIELDSIGFIQEKVERIKKVMSEMLYKAGNIINPDVDDKKYKEIVDSLDMKVTDEDLKNENVLVDYVDFLATDKKMRKVDSSSQAEIIQNVAVGIKNSEFRKATLLIKMTDSILFNKNLKKLETAKMYLNGGEDIYTSAIYNSIINKHKEYNDYRIENLQKVFKKYGVDVDMLNGYDLKESLKIKEVVGKKNIEHYNFFNKEGLDFDTRSFYVGKSDIYKGVGEKRAFINFGEVLLENGIKDSNGKLQSEIMSKKIDYQIEESSSLQLG